MALVGTAQMLRHAYQEGYAVPGFCVWNAETIRTVLQVATEQNAPVILMSGPGELSLLPPSVLGPIARAEAESLQIPVAIHLDHGNSLEMVAECLDAGFTSVMLDASDRPFAENVSLTQQAVSMARQAGADSEGEIGAVGQANHISIEGPRAATLTDPEQAAQFMDETGVDALAVSIGNAHGIYAERPNLDFQRLRQIGELVDVPLVLHGGSGTPAQDIRRAIGLGIAKVNVGSDLGYAFGADFTARFADPDDTLWLPLQMVKALEAVAAVIRRWLELTGAAGQAKS